MHTTFPPLSTSWPRLRSSPSRRPRPLHDPPATFACPAGPRRCRSVGIDWVDRFAPGVRAGGWSVPPLWRQTGKSRQSEKAPGTVRRFLFESRAHLARGGSTRAAWGCVPYARAGLGDIAVVAFCAVAAVFKTGGCGGSGGRSAPLGVGGSLPRWPTCSGVSALASGLLGVSRLC